MTDPANVGYNQVAMLPQSDVGELQAAIDYLAARLGRAVKLDDYPGLRVHAYNADHGAVDDLWVDAIVHRVVRDDVTAWLQQFDLENIDRILQIPAATQLGMTARVCVPVRSRDKLHGHLWIVEGEHPMTEEEIAVAAATAEDVGAAMYREHLLDELARAQERELWRDLLSEDEYLRRHAAEELMRSGLLIKPRRAAVLVLRCVAAQELDNDILRRLESALTHARFSAGPRHSLQLVRPDHGLFLIVTPSESFPDGALHRLAERILEGTGRDRKDFVVGISDVQASATDSGMAYRQAMQASKVAEVMPSFGQIVDWSRLGVYRTLASLAPGRIMSDSLHPGLMTLLQRSEEAWLVETLEVYLDNAGQIKPATQILRLHRASLYHRLARIQEITGADLHNGEDRLALHLGLKLARLAGIYPAAATDVSTRDSIHRGTLVKGSAGDAIHSEVGPAPVEVLGPTQAAASSARS